MPESKDFFRLIAKTAPLMIWVTDIAGHVTYFNESYLDFTGLSLAEALGDGWMKVTHPDDVQRCRELYIKAAEQRESFQMEQRLRRYDGEYRWVVSTGVPRCDENVAFAGYLGTAMDITERRQAEEVLSTVNQRLIEAHEEERTHLAQELHDDINQRLTILIWRCDLLLRDSRNLPAPPKQWIEDVRQDVASILSDIQAISHRLHPPHLELGLASSATQLCREISAQKNVDVTLQVDELPSGMPGEVSLCLYRVLQEALQNVTKHSGARRADVRLRSSGDRIELTVKDSGVGFDLDKVMKGRGLGLTSMKERLKSIDGQLVIDSGPKHGTTIRALVSLRHN